MAKKCIGVDVGGTTVKIGILDEEGTLLKKWEIPTRTEECGSRILPDAAESILAVLKEENIPMEDVLGAGLGVPGPVLTNGYVSRCVNLGWNGMYPGEELSALLGGLPVKCNNDANVAALGEMWQGGGKGYENIVMITLGTGVGGGVIIRQQIWNGVHGMGGEIGHIHVRDDETEACNCGSKGCLEQVSSATGIAREARRLLAATDRPSALRGFGAGVTAKDVLDQAKAGDEVALEVVERVASYLGRALTLLTLTIDPEIFIIGGGVSKAGQFLIDAIRKYYVKYETLSEDRPLIGLAKLGNDAGIYGAARMVLG